MKNSITNYLQLKDALNFVSNQRPIILKQLDDKFREQYSLIQTLCKQASSGSMIDPTRNPPEVSEILIDELILFTDLVSHKLIFTEQKLLNQTTIVFVYATGETVLIYLFRDYIFL